MYINLTWNCGVCVGMVFLCCAHACQTLPLRSELTNYACQNKDGVHFFTLNFECHNRYNKSLLCNCENSDIAWSNTNSSECFFLVFLWKSTKSCFFFKNAKKQVFLNPGLNSSIAQSTGKLGSCEDMWKLLDLGWNLHAAKLFSKLVLTWPGTTDFFSSMCWLYFLPAILDECIDQGSQTRRQHVAC